MIRLAFKILPYFLVAFGLLMAMSAIITLFEGYESAPTELAIEDLQSTDKEKLPRWVKVTGGLLHWEEATTIYKEKGNVKTEQQVLVPLISRGDLSSWGRYKEGRKTLVVVSFPWTDFRSKFPKLSSVASVSKSDTTISDGDLVQFNEHCFDASETEVGVSFLSGLAKSTMQNWVTVNGFKHSLAVVLDSKPMGIMETVTVGMFGGLFLAGGIFWIRKRRKARAAATM